MVRTVNRRMDPVHSHLRAEPWLPHQAVPAHSAAPAIDQGRCRIAHQQRACRSYTESAQQHKHTHIFCHFRSFPTGRAILDCVVQELPDDGCGEAAKVYGGMAKAHRSQACTPAAWHAHSGITHMVLPTQELCHHRPPQSPFAVAPKPATDPGLFMHWQARGACWMDVTDLQHGQSSIHAWPDQGRALPHLHGRDRSLSYHPLAHRVALSVYTTTQITERMYWHVFITGNGLRRGRRQRAGLLSKGEEAAPIHQNRNVARQCMKSH